MQNTSWRKRNRIVPEFSKKDKTVIPATRFFDQMAVIGDEVVTCFVVDTEEGYVLIDSLEPKSHCHELIEQGFRNLGFDITKLKAIVISHGHGDHFGGASYLQNAYGCDIYMGEKDYEMAAHLPKGAPWDPADFIVTRFIQDQEVLHFGSQEVFCYLTPGHTEGCFSFIIPVSDEGRRHNVALWGGSGLLPHSDAGAYQASLEYFSACCTEKHVDAEIATHPSLDNGVIRYGLVRNIVDGVPNPFVLGEEGYHYYEQQFYQLAKERGGVPKSGVSPRTPSL